MADVVTVDFHVTSECGQECPYCWGPQEIEAVDTDVARAIVRKIAGIGARRVVFTGGDPLERSDLGELIREAKDWGLEVALSPAGDQLTPELLQVHGESIDLVSLPLDGPSEEISSRTKKPGHFTAILHDLDLLAKHPAIDVKIATPVTRHNLESVPDIVALLDVRARHQPNRFFYNVFQVFPRAMSEVDWDALLVSDAEFAALRERVEAGKHVIRIHWLDHRTLDRLYVMVFPDGSLTVPSGSDYLDYGPFLDVTDFDEVLSRTDFDAPKHRRHSRGWTRSKRGRPTAPGSSA